MNPPPNPYVQPFNEVGVFDFSRLRLRSLSRSDLAYKVFVENRDRRDFDLDAPGLKVVIGDRPQFRRDALHA